ncbi:MAG: AgmX/PglI C-terminal domain-containing protein [Deltaproteobacteria bacterium]|nr:AgmX/PglI C-terminal domain-containing protein [Deltaproteobacteria bacterium]
MRHAIDPRGGATSIKTRALLAFGAVAVSGAALGFIVAAKVAADNARAHDALIARGKPEWAFRPETLPRSADLGFALGGGLGLAAILWGLSRRRDERQSPRVRIGSGAGVDFAAPAAPSVDFDLIAPTAGADGFQLNLGGQLAAETAIGAPRAITESTVAITAGTRLRVRCGAVTFHVAGVAAPARQTAALFASIDRRVASYFAGSLAAHAALLLLLRSIPPDAENVPAEMSAAEEAGMRFASIANEDKKPDPITPSDGESNGGTDHPGMVAMAQPEGAVGAPNQHNENPAKFKSTGEMTRDRAIAEARRAGVLDLFTGDQAMAMIGNDSLSAGFDELDQMGSYDGNGDGVPDGSFGKGRRGIGPGGGTVVAGDYHTIGNGQPGGDEFAFPGNGKCAAGRICKGGGRPPVSPPVKPGKPIISDDNIGAIVQRYIKRYKDRIGYCYERALLGNGELAGTVTVAFVIDAAGQVLSSNATGVDGDLDQCVASVVSGIKFPRLADSGTFQVRYPFILTKPNK